MFDQERAPDRRSSNDIVEAVHACLQEWRGWSRIVALLAERPDMELHLAGGALRDAIGGRGWPSRDVDFFLEERDLDSVVDQLARDGRIGRGVFGSPLWYPAGEEPGCDLIAIQRFHNGLGRCRDMLDVLDQFDFTANAMALDLRRGRFFDRFDAVGDLRRGVMRAIRLDYPDEPVVPGHELTRNDVLWFRLVHYTAQLGLEIEPETLAWLRDNARALHRRALYEADFRRLHPQTDEVLERHGLV